MTQSIYKRDLEKRIAYLEATISNMLWHSHTYPPQWGLDFDANVAKRYKLGKAKAEAKDKKK